MRVCAANRRWSPLFRDNFLSVWLSVCLYVSLEFLRPHDKQNFNFKTEVLLLFKFNFISTDISFNIFIWICKLRQLSAPIKSKCFAVPSPLLHCTSCCNIQLLVNVRYNNWGYRPKRSPSLLRTGVGTDPRSRLRDTCALRVCAAKRRRNPLSHYKNILLHLKYYMKYAIFHAFPGYDELLSSSVHLCETQIYEKKMFHLSRHGEYQYTP